MSKLEFDTVGERFFETGVSQGVLFPGVPKTGANIEGIAWNGLTSVSESPEGGDANDQYADNIKYLSLRGAENVNGTIEAFTYPVEFEQCMGRSKVNSTAGAYFSQQTKLPFSFAFITQYGNDEKGSDYSEKLHIVWNATCDPVEKSYATINDSPEAMTMSFAYKTVPLPVEGYKATSLFTMTKPAESDTAALAKYNTIKDMIYGTESAKSKLPLPADIITALA